MHYHVTCANVFFCAGLTNKISSISTMLGLSNLALSIGGKLRERLDIGELPMACINNT